MVEWNVRTTYLGEIMFEKILETATDVKEFSVLSAIQGTAYPRDNVTVYTDAAAAYEVKILEQRSAETEDEDEVNALDKQRQALVEKIKASGLTFHLHGFAPQIVKAINESAAAANPEADLDEGPVAREINFRYLAEAISKVVSADGAEDTHHWNVDEVTTLEATLPPEEFARLMIKMDEVVFASLVFDATVNADF
jgi:hypothetical protein